jgi:hypothetical protein
MVGSKPTAVDRVWVASAGPRPNAVVAANEFIATKLPFEGE